MARRSLDWSRDIQAVRDEDGRICVKHADNTYVLNQTGSRVMREFKVNGEGPFRNPVDRFSPLCRRIRRAIKNFGEQNGATAADPNR